MTSETEALAREIVELKEQMRALATSRQIARSTVQIGGEPVRVPDAIGDALTKASEALTTADGKNRIFRGESEPVPEEGAPFAQGDLWFRLDTAGQVVAIEVWNGDDWVPQVLAAEDIIAAGTITGPMIKAGSISAREMVIGDSTNLLADPNFAEPLGVIWKDVPSAAIEDVPDVGRAYVVMNTPDQDDLPGNSIAIAVTPGTRLTFRCMYQSAPGVSADLRLRWLDVDGNFASSTHGLIPGGVIISERPWTSSSITIEVPATAPFWWTDEEGQLQYAVRPVAGALFQISNTGEGAVRLARPQLLRTPDVSFTDSAGVLRTRLDENSLSLRGADAAERFRVDTSGQLVLRNASGGLLARLRDSGFSLFYDNTINFYGVSESARWGTINRWTETGSVGIQVWGGSESQSQWAYLAMGLASDGLFYRSQGLRQRSSTNPANVVVGTTGLMATATSLKRHKLDVQDQDSSSVLDVPYRSWIDRQAMVDAVLGRAEAPEHRTVGAIAEEMEQVAPELCTYDPDGTLTGVAYDRVALALIPILRDLTNRVEALEGADPTVWPESPVYDDTALWDEVTAYGENPPEEITDMTPPLPTAEMRSEE